MDDQILLQLINDAAESGQESLNLSGQELDVLPPEIGKLTRLIQLDLWGNQLTPCHRRSGN